MRFVQHNGLQFLQFPHLMKCPGIWHGIAVAWTSSNRHAPRRFNLGLGCGMTDAAVWQNRHRLLSTIHPTARGVFTKQVHGATAVVWHEKTPGDQTIAGIVEGDALITADPLTILFIQVADCQPVIVIDPVQRVVANIHSGWRGSIQNIIGATIEKMVSRFDCRPEHLLCGIGPSLGPCCSEFINFRTEIPERLWRYRRAHDHFDFWRMSVDQLIQAGVRANNIDVCGVCTKCNPHLFFSYRHQKQTGRFSSVVGVIPDKAQP